MPHFGRRHGWSRFRPNNVRTFQPKTAEDSWGYYWWELSDLETPSYGWSFFRWWEDLGMLHGAIAYEGLTHLATGDSFLCGADIAQPGTLDFHSLDELLAYASKHQEDDKHVTCIACFVVNIKRQFWQGGQ